MWTICTLFLLSVAGTLTYATDKPFALPLVGGNTSSTIDHLYLVAIVKDGGNRWNLTCGGAIINESYVLTAANCMKYASEKLYVVAGTKDLQKGSGQTRCISEFIVRADYNSSVPYGRSDVAVVKLTSPLTLKAGEVEKAALNTNTSCPVTGASCTVLGWRNTNGQQSDIRQQCSTDIYGLESCKKKYGNSTSTRLNDGNMCAGNKSANGRDVCQSASGSPLVCQCAENHTVVGAAVSCSRECGLADGPGVYTSVAYFHGWISLSNINDSRTHAVKAFPDNDSGPVVAAVIAEATIGPILFVIVVIIGVWWRMCRREGKFCQPPCNGSKDSRITKLKGDDQLTCLACGEVLHYHKTPRCSGPPQKRLMCRACN